MLLDTHRLLGDATHPWLVYGLALIVTVLASGRMTRLLYHDSFPPAVWLRERFAAALREEWAILPYCPWCLGPWVVLIDGTWAMVGTLDTSTVSGTCWWLANLWFTVAYLCSMLIVRDEPPQ